MVEDLHSHWRLEGAAGPVGPLLAEAAKTRMSLQMLEGAAGPVGPLLVEAAKTRMSLQMLEGAAGPLLPEAAETRRRLVLGVGATVLAEEGVEQGRE